MSVSRLETEPERLETTLARLTATLLAQMSEGHWSGELSSSALSTAVAVVALRQIDLQHGTQDHQRWIQAGLAWLGAHANADGGWGDTIRSKSNLSTTALGWAAFGACGADRNPAALRAEAWLSATAGSLERLPTAIADRYGRDRTFSVPILMTLAISGRLGKDGWRNIPALPFELAMLPRRFFGALRLPVVSYALPALIAIGQAIHHHAPAANPVARWTRNFSRARTLACLASLQPDNGGFLEATPLTAFVTMSLACVGAHDDVVARKGAAFLRASMREDGSWPIDTNLATWVTTLSIKALSYQPDVLAPHAQGLRAWLLRQQTKTIHPYTGAAAGGWAWTDLPGGVPDADDTAGALLALAELGAPDGLTIQAVEAGVTWLLDVANSDGGIPTFCRGWGTLPFDRSTPDITAHALRAWCRWRDLVSPTMRPRINQGMERALRFLASSQQPDGSWIPLWFGNETAIEESNPVYGTSQVVLALNELQRRGVRIPQSLAERGLAYLATAQQATGGWGGDPRASESIEETAVALEALSDSPTNQACVGRGTQWLLQSLTDLSAIDPAPIGLYFARLWYFERLYPLIFSVGALSKLSSRAEISP